MKNLFLWAIAIFTVSKFWLKGAVFVRNESHTKNKKPYKCVRQSYPSRREVVQIARLLELQVTVNRPLYRRSVPESLFTIHIVHRS